MSNPSEPSITHSVYISKSISFGGIAERSAQKFPITVPITIEIKRRKAIKAVNQRTRVPSVAPVGPGLQNLISWNEAASQQIWYRLVRLP